MNIADNIVKLNPKERELISLIVGAYRHHKDRTVKQQVEPHMLPFIDLDEAYDALDWAYGPVLQNTFEWKDDSSMGFIRGAMRKLEKMR